MTNTMCYLTYMIFTTLIIPLYAQGMVSVGQKHWHEPIIEKPDIVIISSYLAHTFSYDPKLNRFTNKKGSPLISSPSMIINNELEIPALIEKKIALKEKWAVSFYPATFYLCALFSGKISAMQTLFNTCNGKLETLLPSDNLAPTHDPAFKHGIVFYSKKPLSIPKDTSELAMNHFASAPPSLKLKLINILI